METMIKLLFSKYHWHIKEPKLIISVTGGAKLNLKERLKETFCKGLVRAATTTGQFNILEIQLKYGQISLILSLKKTH